MRMQQFIILSGKHPFSAKGAIFTSKPGAAPQASRNANASALKARFTFVASSLREYPELNRAFSADSWCNRIPGTLPQAKADTAPMALSTTFR
jgi:hypothetical protein